MLVSRWLYRALDVISVCFFAVGMAFVLVLLFLRPTRQFRAGSSHHLVMLSTMYTLRVLRARRAEHILTWRDLDGYFEHVWSVHPLVGAAPVDSSEAAIGAPTVTRVNGSHTMVEGKIGRFGALNNLPWLNFALAQTQLVLALDGIIHREPSTLIRGDPYYCGLLALLLGKLNRHPVEVRIIANHDALYEATGELAHPRLFRTRWVEKRVARFVLSHVDAVVVGSEDNAKFARANLAHPQRLLFSADLAMIDPVHLTEPKKREPFDDEFGLGDRPVVVCVSRLERSKHVEDVVEALVIARQRRPDIIGLFVGTGSREEELRQRCRELGVAEHIILAGERDQPWIARMLPRCTVVAAPLSGLALVESALSETPIVAYDIEWHSELLQTGRTGILVPFNDYRAMAMAICELVDDRSRARTLGAAARRHVLAIVDYEKQVEQERALADWLLKSRP